jgi:hypothetical protein
MEPDDIQKQMASDTGTSIRKTASEANPDTIKGLAKHDPESASFFDNIRKDLSELRSRRYQSSRQHLSTIRSESHRSALESVIERLSQIDEQKSAQKFATKNEQDEYQERFMQRKAELKALYP